MKDFEVKNCGCDQDPCKTYGSEEDQKAEYGELKEAKMSKLLKEQWNKLAFSKGNKSLNESEDIYPRPQHPMVANASENTKKEMIDLITDILMEGTGLVPVACESAAEEIVVQLRKAGYC